MAEPSNVFVAYRGEGRRAEDRQLLDHLFRHSRIADVSRAIMSELNLEALFELIVNQTVELLGAEHCTVFLHDKRSDQLWSIIGTDLDKITIRIPADVGIAGWVFNRCEPLIVNDAYGDPRFCRDVDMATGFTTHNLLCIPLINRSDVCIGSLEALNKKAGDFTDKDRLLLATVAQYIVIALENGRLYENLKAVNDARKKVIDHLAHELRTPVAIIDAALAIIAGKLDGATHADVARPLARCQRNLKRLLRLQEKIGDILDQRCRDDQDQATRMIETVFSLAEELGEEKVFQADVVQKLLQRLASIHEMGDFRPEPIAVSRFLDRVCDQALAAAQPRTFTLIRRIEPGLALVFDPSVLEKTCAGLLKNAIEATPDEGMVMVAAGKADTSITIDVQDWGVGISPENQGNLFAGFFHTQDTAFYASKQPYAFGAGGSGADLLRIKAFSERFGFKIDFTSRHCGHLADGIPICPGSISACGWVKGLADCMAAGGTTFSLRFPVQ